MLDFLYEASDRERAIFGKFWCGPAVFPHSGYTLVAKLPKTCGDGYEVEIYCSAMPARFYQVRALPGPNSVNKHRDGFTLGTGSDMARFAMEFAKHAADGMLGMHAPAPELPANAEQDIDTAAITKAGADAAKGGV